MKTVRIRMLAALAAASVFLGQELGAQTRSTTSGFFLTGGVNGTSIDSDDLNQDESGPGLFLGGGYGFNSHFALFLDLVGASIDAANDDYVLSHADLGVRYHFGDRTRAFRPYLDAAFTARSASLDDQTIEGDDDVDIEISGGGFTLGGGIMYFFNPKWAFNARVRWTTGEFSRVRVENVTVDGLDFDATTVRISLGLAWFPRGG